ncbi:hypothetical protein I4U23_005679 [Adineta vaga]|nr:hypothetical protein I4U23_005679 [Adineta vaga]
MFWLLLPNGSSTQDISSISSIPNQSVFLKRVDRDQFDFHQLPHRSLLKLSGKEFCNNQYSSTLIKAYGPGAIFPLSLNKQNLYQFNYHYQGGIRYWYIILSNERIKLENLFKENYPSICLEHDEILIDPLLLNKFNIKYKRIIQKPKEILILSSGIFSQGFAQDEMLSESIHFALPSWFYDHFTKNSSSCHCKLSSNLGTNESIDLNLYNDKNIQEYIQKYLQINIYQNEDSKSDTDITCDDNNTNEDDFLMNIFDESIDIMKYSQFDNETDFNELCLSEDLFDDIFMDNNQSEPLNTTETPPSPSNNQLTNQQIHLKKKKFSRIIDRSKFIITTNDNQSEIDVNKILYLSNLSEQISRNELRNYFIGSTKIILKQSRLPPYLNYAFIFHRTHIQAEFNRKKVIHSSCFGSNCKIKFIKNLSELSNENKCDENWNIVIKQIPENVTENDLKKLFFNSNQIKYIPSRMVQKSNTNYKTLPG